MTASTTHGPKTETTLDTILGGRVRLLQPKKGYRVGVDAVLLAAATLAERGDRVLDVGCGVGAASFCLHARAPGAALEGIEVQPELAALSKRNALENSVGGWLAHAGDFRDAPLFVRSTSYDIVMSNPPYFHAAANLASPVSARDVANRETAPLADWLDFCLRRLKPEGILTLIHKAERLPEILSALQGRAGDVGVKPIVPKVGRPASRVVVSAVKGSRTPFRLASPLVLHRDDVAEAGVLSAPFTSDAEAVVSGAAPLLF